MGRLHYGLAALLLLSSGPALAQPTQLSNAEMDRVSAGFFELDVSNTSATAISIFQRTNFFTTAHDTIVCSGCYLQIDSPTISIASQFGPPN